MCDILLIREKFLRERRDYAEIVCKGSEFSALVFLCDRSDHIGHMLSYAWPGVYVVGVWSYQA